jgi:hypothetical protein
MMVKKLLLYVFLLIFFIPAFAQIIPANEPSPEEQDKFMEEIENQSPRLARFRERLNEISKVIQKTLNDYQKGRISRKRAEEILRPFVQEQIEITRNPDFLVEMQLVGLLSVEPETGK